MMTDVTTLYLVTKLFLHFTLVWVEFILESDLTHVCYTEGDPITKFSPTFGARFLIIKISQ